MLLALSPSAPARAAASPCQRGFREDFQNGVVAADARSSIAAGKTLSTSRLHVRQQIETVLRAAALTGKGSVGQPVAHCVTPTSKESLWRQLIAGADCGLRLRWNIRRAGHLLFSAASEDLVPSPASRWPLQRLATSAAPCASPTAWRQVALSADGRHLQADPEAFAGSVWTPQALCGDCYSEKPVDWPSNMFFRSVFARSAGFLCSNRRVDLIF